VQPVNCGKHTECGTRRVAYRCTSLVCLALSLLIAAGVHGSTSNLVVRVMDAKSGKPISKVGVATIYWNGAEEVDPHTLSHEGQVIDHAATDSGGRAVFVLPEPLPEHIGFILEPPMDFAGCSSHKVFSPGEILRSGVISEYDRSKCGKLLWQPSAKPGEIVLFDKKLTLGERMRREGP
jgi:hypothetical protein